MNPNAMVPLLQDGAFTLWESNVIVRYLCATYSAEVLFPKTLSERFLAEQWMDWQQTTLNPAGRHAFLQLIRTPAAQRQAELLRQSNEDTDKLMALLDAQLSQHAFVAGTQFSMADIPIGCEVHRWFGLPQTRTARPHVERWYHALCERPASKGVLDLALT
jgi:glutathione S-transferase